MRNSRLVWRVLSILLAAWAVFAFAMTPATGDTIVLSDGSAHVGTIEREAESFVTMLVMDGDKEVRKTFFVSDIKVIERDGAIHAPRENNAPAAEPTPPGAVQIAFITLEDQVGPYINNNALLGSIEILDNLPEESQPDVVVLWIDSEGGFLHETEKIIQTINENLKPNYRTVVWVRSAMTTSCLISLMCPEIYMMSNAPLGAMTVFIPPGAQPRDVQQQEQIIFDLAKHASHHPLIIRAMSRCEPGFQRNDLTADIDDAGNVTLFDGSQGEHMVCPKDRILVLDSIKAVKFGLAEAIADTKGQLAEALGAEVWVEVGQDANEHQVRHRANYKLAEQEMEDLYAKLNIHLEFAGEAETTEEQDAYIGRALRYLGEMREAVKNSPMLVEYSMYNDQWFKSLEQRVREIRQH